MKKVLLFRNSISFDYFVDATNGNDSNDGLTAGTAWASLSQIDISLLTAGETVNVSIASDTYDTANDYVLLSGGATDFTGAVMNLYFGENTVMDGTNTGLNINGFEQNTSGGSVWTLNVFGNGLTVENYNGNSENGFGNRNSCIINIYDADVTNCEDGFSAHDTSTMNIYRCSASECNKSPFIHVGTSNVYAEDSTFTEKIGGGSLRMSVTGSNDTPTIESVNCAFIQDANNSSTRIIGTYRNCQWGTLNKNIFMVNAIDDSTVLFEDCFVNIYSDGQFINYQRCYGKISTRVSNNGSFTAENCVIVDRATSQGRVISSPFDRGSSSSFIFNNNIIQLVDGFRFMDIDATNAGYLVAANAEFFNNCLFGSSYDSDLVSADSGGTVIVDTLTADPLIGSANTLIKSDYGYSSGSPCIGAGTSGSNIGFPD